MRRSLRGRCTADPESLRTFLDLASLIWFACATDRRGRPQKWHHQDPADCSGSLHDGGCWFQDQLPWLERASSPDKTNAIAKSRALGRWRRRAARGGWQGRGRLNRDLAAPRASLVRCMTRGGSAILMPALGAVEFRLSATRMW
ncbi:hypothetical protein VTK26DRAFT_6110 [Humicola hyalothermophila]